MLAVASMVTPGKRSHADIDSSPSDSPLKRSTGSPSARRLAELSFQNESYNRELFLRLEHDERRRGLSHHEALLAAAWEHERVRRVAQLEQERNALDMERSKQREEDAERQALDLERQRQIQAEIEESRRQAEEAKRLSGLQKNAEEERLRQEEEAQRLEQTQREDERRREEQKQAEERAAAELEAQAQAEKAAKASQPTPPPNKTPVDKSTGLTPAILLPSVVSSKDEIEAEHKKYLDLHLRLKDMRKTVVEQSKSNPQLKEELGNWRRTIKARVGMMSTDKGGTIRSKNEIVAALNQALKAQEPSVDARKYIVAPLPSGLDAAKFQFSGPLLYLLNMICKRIVAYWKGTDAITQGAEPGGILAATIFAMDEYKWQGIPFIDLLLAKLHVVCPVLFGIYGNEKTDAGRKRIGWGSGDSTRWITEDRHWEVSTGLGAGFASVSLRKFPAKSSRVAPYPPSNYWTALSRILNTPGPEVTTTHFVVLKGMIEHPAPRFVDFFGMAAIVALRTAIYILTAKAPASPANAAMSTIPDILQRDYNIYLT